MKLIHWIPALVLGLSTLALADPLGGGKSPRPNSMQGVIKVGPSFEVLRDKLAKLRAEKLKDYHGARKLQAYYAAEIEKIKRALRNHHRERGRRAAMNQPMDYDPPRTR